jgi:HPt (histidine-containing phosphotransfer) domain-containing protein
MNEPIDYNQLLKRCLNEQAIVFRVLSRYAQSAPGLLADCQAALQEGRFMDAANMAHSLKGASASIAAGAMTALSDRLYHHCRNGDHTAIDDTLPRLDEQLRAVLALIHSRYAGAAHLEEK